MVQRGHAQLMGILLIGWWGGKWKSASSTFWFQLVWLLCPGAPQGPAQYQYLYCRCIISKILPFVFSSP